MALARSRIRSDLQKLINHVTASSDAWGILSGWELNGGEDRSQAIVAASLLEQALEYAIASHFVLSEQDVRNLFSDQAEGSISSFATKIKLAYALGIIENTIRSELIAIKDIRNVFAHTRVTVSFETSAIIAACDALRVPGFVSYEGLLGPAPVKAKEKFAHSIKWIYLYLAHAREELSLKYEQNDYYCNIFLKKQSTHQIAQQIINEGEGHSG